MNLNRLAYFAAVVDTGSFTRAAERLGITKAVVSQQVAQLERDLGTSLLVRTTRRVHPTEAGRMFHARCVMILREAEDAFDELAQAAAAPTGTLRITAPNDYGTAVVVAVVTAYAARYPNCRVELTLEDQTVDLASGQIDMAIRVGWLVDSSLQARKIGAFRQILVGAPAFTDRIAPRAIPTIWWRCRSSPTWRCASRCCGSSRAAISIDAPCASQANIAIDTTPGVLAAVLAGGGLSVLPDFLVADDLAAGRLIHILPQWQLPSGGIHTVYPAARFRPPKVTAFVEMLIAAQRQASSIGADELKGQ